MKDRWLRFVVVNGLASWLSICSPSIGEAAEGDEPAVDPAAAEPVMENDDCLLCHSDEELTMEDGAGNVILLFVDEEKYSQSVHGVENCVSCHADVQEGHPDDEIDLQPVDCSLCHERQSVTYGISAHALAVQDGNGAAAYCVDCHGTHDILPSTSPESPLHRSNLAKTCGECHPDVTDEVAQSVHGEALARNEREAPSCLDCHFEHKIEPLHGTSPLYIAEEVCSRCHASERMNTKYNLPSDRVKTFFDSYHGLAAQFGSTRAANCASCHGYHLVLPSNDPRSMIHKDNLVETCGACHPGATANFAGGKIHLDDTKEADLGSVINRWIRRVYKGLIVAVIGGMLIHNFLAWRKKAAASLRAPGRTVVRMNRWQRYQHLVLLVSFIYLVISGFALAYPGSWIAWLMGSDETFRSVSHRVAGVVLLGLGLVHILYAALTREGRRLVTDLWFSSKDLRDVWQNLRYYVRSKAARPRFGRFGYAEKCEYWAVVWGTVIMGVTGLMLWFALDVTRFVPRWAVEVATTIHFYEAVLATLAIIVWHFYHVIFDPDVYPMNWAAWDGKVDAHWYAEEHPMDTAGEENEGKPAPAVEARKPHLPEAVSADGGGI